MEENRNNIAVNCVNCGKELTEGQMFCPDCGTPRPEEPKKNLCANCGTELQDGQMFCPNCGQKVGVQVDANVNAAISQFNQEVKKKNTKPIIIAVVAVIAVVLLFNMCSGSVESGPDFKSLYNEYCISTWADVGSDGSYLSVDTNPYDEDDNGIAYYAAYTAVQNINSALNLPESLLSDMGETRSMDGRQTQTFEEQGVTVSWTYHPDAGLEVTYKKAN